MSDRNYVADFLTVMAFVVVFALACCCFTEWCSASTPYPQTIEDRVDFVETNHFYDENGKLIFDQVIFLEWCDAAECERIVAWRLVKSPDQLPRFNHSIGQWECVWTDDVVASISTGKETFRNESARVIRRVVADGVRESWTQFDPELEARKVFPKEHRRELRRAKCR